MYITQKARSRACVQANKANAEFDEINEKSEYDVINRMKDWMIDYLRRWGFWAILV